MTPRHMRRWSLVATLLALGVGGTARAHAGLPETSNVTLRRGHPEDFFLGATFGAVISRDSGKTFRWICPTAMNYGGWSPNAYLWREAGDLMAATGSALLRSPDGGCSWNTHPYFKDTWVAGLAAHPTDDRILYVVTSRHGKPNGVYRSLDGGETWAPSPLLRQGLVLNAVRVSPANPQRLYVSGKEESRMLLLRSDDAGETWTEVAHPLSELMLPYDLLVETADPISPDVLWARVSSQGATYLLRSDDAGQTLKVISTINDVFINMELSADGKTAWVGTLNHFFRGPSTGPLQMLSLPTGNACVLRDGQTLYGCGSTWLHDWAFARSTDEGSTWQALFGLYEIQGTHHCPKGTPVRDLCPGQWPQLAEQLGAPLYPDGPPEEPPEDAGTSEDAGTPVDAGTTPEDAGTTPQPLPTPKGSGGCGAMGGNMVPVLLLLSTLTLLRRGRRRQN
ncbi:WD40/YVTN/BNR-like repeat-containing protein [Corallococcus terminator]